MYSYVQMINHFLKWQFTGETFALQYLFFFPIYLLPFKFSCCYYRQASFKTRNSKAWRNEKRKNDYIEWLKAVHIDHNSTFFFN